MNRGAQHHTITGVTVYRVAIYLICGCLCIAAAGCGQKGPLYLPGTAPEVVPANSAPQPKPTDPPAATPDDKPGSSSTTKKNAASQTPGD